MYRTDLKDDEGPLEWAMGREAGHEDQRWDDNVDIVIREDGTVEVKYLDQDNQDYHENITKPVLGIAMSPDGAVSLTWPPFGEDSFTVFCRDNLLNGDWMRDAVDPDGNPRIWRGKDSWTVDMGGYEYGSSSFRTANVAKAAETGAELTWNSRPGDSYIIWSAADLSAKNPWTTKEATIASGGESTTWTDPDTTSIQKFYRIEIE